MFFAYTSGAILPDDDAGRDDVLILAQHAARLNGDPARNIAGHVQQWCPWMGEAELAALVRRVLARPIKWTADALGHRVGLLDVVRTMLRITTIRPIDVPAAELERRRRDRWNAKRRTRTRIEYLAASLSRAKPWEAEGVCRRTWERRRGAKAVSQVRVSKDSSRVTHTCDNPRQHPVETPLACHEEGSVGGFGAPPSSEGARWRKKHPGDKAERSRRWPAKQREERTQK